MDLRYFAVQPLPRPRTPTRASDFVKDLSTHLKFLEHQVKAEQAVRISYGGPLGVMRALRVTPDGTDSLSIAVVDDNGVQSEIVAPVEQCSFMFTIFTPGSDSEREKIVLGFAERAPASPDEPPRI